MQDIRATIIEAVARAGLSHSEIARRAKLSRPRLVEYLAGRKHIRSDCLERLMGALRLTIGR